jgi:hypothetical protein
MDVTALRTAIKAHGFEADTDTQQLEFLNAIQRKIAGAHPWDWTRATATVAVVAGTSDYARPSDTSRLRSVRLVYGTVLEELSHVDYEELLNARERSPLGYTAVPTAWSFVAPASIALWPTPGAAGTLTVRYHRVPPALTAGADVPILPAEYHDILVVGACQMMAQRERQWESVAGFKAEYDDLYRAMRGQLGLRQHQSANTVARSGAYSGV